MTIFGNVFKTRLFEAGSQERGYSSSQVIRINKQFCCYENLLTRFCWRWDILWIGQFTEKTFHRYQIVNSRSDVRGLILPALGISDWKHQGVVELYRSELAISCRFPDFYRPPPPPPQKKRLESMLNMNLYKIPLVDQSRSSQPHLACLQRCLF